MREFEKCSFLRGALAEWDDVVGTTQIYDVDKYIWAAAVCLLRESSSFVRRGSSRRMKSSRSHRGGGEAQQKSEKDKFPK